ncbi:MAG: hypothetical protein IPG11_17565 [Flavobacteriales bacterium]|nr:hypothetical protein [Flavobacteriales bacterium]
MGGSHGIYYDFATKALGAFADAVAKLAVPEDEGMGERGRIPNKNRLVITGTALGSFGFELEEAPTGELYSEEGTLTEQALEQITDILSNTRASNDDLARSLSDAHPRALTSVREFLDLLAKNDAIMGLTVKDRSFRFTQVAEVQQSLDRLKIDNVHEAEQIIRGRFHPPSTST